MNTHKDTLIATQKYEKTKDLILNLFNVSKMSNLWVSLYREECYQSISLNKENTLSQIMFSHNNEFKVIKTKRFEILGLFLLTEFFNIKYEYDIPFSENIDLFIRTLKEEKEIFCMKGNINYIVAQIYFLESEYISKKGITFNSIKDKVEREYEPFI